MIVLTRMHTCMVRWMATRKATLRVREELRFKRCLRVFTIIKISNAVEVTYEESEWTVLIGDLDACAAQGRGGIRTILNVFALNLLR